MKHDDETALRIFPFPGLECTQQTQWATAFLIAITDIVQQNGSGLTGAELLFKLARRRGNDPIDAKAIQLPLPAPRRVAHDETRVDALLSAQFAREKIGVVAHPADSRRQVGNDLPDLLHGSPRDYPCRPSAPGNVDI